MKEDLAIARNSVLALQAENGALRKAAADPNLSGLHAHSESLHAADKVDPEMAEALAEERRKRAELERELDLQNQIKLETDTAMKLLEKDIHEKQDTIVSLRRQLEDIKQINLDMYRKLQVLSCFQNIFFIFCHNLDVFLTLIVMSETLKILN